MVRLKDVANMANVSLFSVSKVLNGNWREAHITEQCAKRVQAAARELGYTPNYHAQSLTRGSSQTIGLVLHEPRFNDPDFTSGLMVGIESQLTSRKHDLLIVGRRGDDNEIQHGIECLRQRRVDALIVPGCLGEMIMNEAFESAKGVIVLAVQKPNSVHPAVDVDPAPGIDEAVRHLFELGHRKIMWLAPDLKSGGAVASARRKAFLASTAKYGIRGFEETFVAPGYLLHGQERSELVRNHFAGVLQTSFDFSAVMCFNDAAALGVCLAAHDRRIHVPQDFSVIGFDDFHGRTSIPRLTTVSHELAAIGARAAELAIEMACDSKLHERLRGGVETIPARLVVRESTAAPRSSRRRSR